MLPPPRRTREGGVAHPWLLGELFVLSKAAKETYVRQLEAAGPASPEDEARLHLAKLVGDPLPYGIGPNRDDDRHKIFEGNARKLFTRAEF